MKKRVFLCALLMLMSCFTIAAQQAPAPQPLTFFRLELDHVEQVTEDLEFVAPGEPGQFGNGFRDEGHGLVRAALPTLFIGWRSPIPARSLALPAAPCLAQKICIQSDGIFKK